MSVLLHVDLHAAGRFGYKVGLYSQIEFGTYGMTMNLM